MVDGSITHRDLQAGVAHACEAKRGAGQITRLCLPRPSVVPVNMGISQHRGVEIRACVLLLIEPLQAPQTI